VPRADDDPGHDRLSTAAFAVGLAAALTGVVYFVAIPLGVAGLVTGLIARRRAAPGSRRVAVGGILLSLVGLLVGTGLVVVLLAADEDADPDPTDRPPQHDLDAQVDCQADIGVLRAAGHVTNSTGETVTYYIEAVWENDGRTIAAQTAVIEDVTAGEARRWEVTAEGDGDVATTCRVAEIDRQAQ
jgi:hypothetical protein